MEESTPNAGHGPKLLYLLHQMKMLTSSPEWKNFVQVAGEDMIKCLPSSYNSPGRGKTYPMPTEVRTIFNKGLAKILTTNVKQRYSNLVTEMLPQEKEDIILLFVSSFIRRFGPQVLAYVFKCMKLAVAPNAMAIQKKSKTDAEMKYFKETVHFVGGSVLRRVLRFALPLQEKYEKWNNVIEVIRSHFLIGELADAPEEELMEWTKKQDRGGLLVIGDKALTFFSQVGLIAEDIETPAGDVDFESLKAKVLCSETYYVWDGLIKDELPRVDSNFLLDLCCKHFCNTWGVGTAKMKMNQIFSKGTDSSTLRPSLMKKKS